MGLYSELNESYELVGMGAQWKAREEKNPEFHHTTIAGCMRVACNLCSNYRNGINIKIGLCIHRKTFPRGGSDPFRP